MVTPLFWRGSRLTDRELERLRLEAERGHTLVEASREIVVVVDERNRVLATSRRARESLEGVVEGAPLPERLLDPAAGRALVVPYEVAGRCERLVYLSQPGDLAAYEELRAGFTAAVSHELRTPLARLLVLLDSAGLPGGDTPDLLEQARGEVRQIGELIDDVLFLSELESGREVVSLGTTQALPVLERVLREADESAARAGVTLRLDCPATVDVPLRQRMLEVVAGNLTENAIRYAGEGATFMLSAAAEDGRVVIEARDDGAGLDEAELPRIFERFYRADATRSSRGTGLGLAIVKHVVASAGGFTEAAGGPGQGLTVRCVFPR